MDNGVRLKGRKPARRARRRTYLQGRNGDAGGEDRLVDTAGEAEGGRNREQRGTRTSPRVKQPARGNSLCVQGAQPGAP